MNVGARVFCFPRVCAGTVIDRNQGQSMVAVQLDGADAAAYFPLRSLIEIVSEDGELLELADGRQVLHGKLTVDPLGGNDA